MKEDGPDLLCLVSSHPSYGVGESVFPKTVLPSFKALHIRFDIIAMKTTLVALILAALADGAVISDRVGATRQKRAPKENGKSFTINQIENKNFKGHDGQMSLVRAHMKYAQKLPDHVSKALENDLDLRLKFGVFSQGN